MSKAEIFVEGDYVVYPTHGVGKVERIATEEIAGHILAVQNSTGGAVGSAARPARIFSKVVLPQPEGPTSATNSPAATSKLTSETARNSGATTQNGAPTGVGSRPGLVS